MSIFIYYTISYQFRIIREVTQELTGKKYRWTVGALLAAHQGSEAYIITILEKGNLAAIHAGRVTLMPKDIQLAMQLADVTQNFKTTKPVTKLESEKEKKEKEEWRKIELENLKQKRKRDITPSSPEDEPSSSGNIIAPFQPLSSEESSEPSASRRRKKQCKLDTSESENESEDDSGAGTPSKRCAKKLDKSHFDYFERNGFTDELVTIVFDQGWDVVDIENYILLYNHNYNARVPVLNFRRKKGIYGPKSSKGKTGKGEKFDENIENGKGKKSGENQKEQNPTKGKGEKSNEKENEEKGKKGKGKKSGKKKENEQDKKGKGEKSGEKEKQQNGKTGKAKKSGEKVKEQNGKKAKGNKGGENKDKEEKDEKGKGRKSGGKKEKEKGSTGKGEKREVTQKGKIVKDKSNETMSGGKKNVAGKTKNAPKGKFPSKGKKNTITDPIVHFGSNIVSDVGESAQSSGNEHLGRNVSDSESEKSEETSHFAAAMKKWDRQHGDEVYNLYREGRSAEIEGGGQHLNDSSDNVKVGDSEDNHDILGNGGEDGDISGNGGEVSGNS